MGFKFDLLHQTTNIQNTKKNMLKLKKRCKPSQNVNECQKSEQNGFNKLD